MSILLCPRVSLIIRHNKAWNTELIALRHGSRKTGIVEPEVTAVTRERSINTFTPQQTRDAKIRNCWKKCSLLGPSKPTRMWRVVIMVCCGSRHTAWIGAAEHESRAMYIIGCRYQAATSEDLKDLALCFSEKSNEWINERAVITCSYDLYVFNKTNNQFRPHVQSLTHDRILIKLLAYWTLYSVLFFIENFSEVLLHFNLWFLIPYST